MNSNTLEGIVGNSVLNEKIESLLDTENRRSRKLERRVELLRGKTVVELLEIAKEEDGMKLKAKMNKPEIVQQLRVKIQQERAQVKKEG